MSTLAHFALIHLANVYNKTMYSVINWFFLCISPVIDSRLAVLDPRLEESRPNSADRESVTGPIQKQPVHLLLSNDLKILNQKKIYKKLTVKKI